MSPGLHRFADLTRAEIASLRDQGALPVVPIGATEQHADHLPVGTDHRLAGAIAEAAARRCASLPVVVLPALPFGLSPHHRLWPGTVTLSGATFVAVLQEIAGSLAATGFGRVLLVNGHGGNIAPMGVAVTELCSRGIACGAVNYFAPGEEAWRGVLTGRLQGVGHACEFETALQLVTADPAIAAAIEARIASLPPRLDQPYLAEPGTADPVRSAGDVFAPVFGLGDCGYLGDPGAATRATGERLHDVLAETLARFFEAFAAASLRVLPAS